MYGLRWIEVKIFSSSGYKEPNLVELWQCKVRRSYKYFSLLYFKPHHGLIKKHHMDKKVCEMFLFDKFAEMVPINHSIFFYNMEGNRGRQKHL